jgi:hypothetical protein
VNDLRDPTAYRIAIGLLGLAEAIALAGIAWASTVHDKVLASGAKDPSHVYERAGRVVEISHVPVEFWFAAGALGGVFVGMLIPFSVCARSSYPCKSGPTLSKWTWGFTVAAIILAISGVAISSFEFGEDFLGLCVLAVTIAGVLLGLLIPSPAGGLGRQRC